MILRSDEANKAGLRHKLVFIQRGQLRIWITGRESVKVVPTCRRSDEVLSSADQPPKAHYFFGGGWDGASLLGGTMFFSRI
jgi:hypothetical protein